MILHLYSGRTETIFRGHVRQLTRLARRIERLEPGKHRIVLSPEDGYSDDQLAVLNAIADHEQQQFLLALDSGRVPIPQ